MNCFVIMPFSDTEHQLEKNVLKKINSSEWDFIFNDWIKKAVESFSKKKINCKRSSTIPGNFVKGIVKDIYNSELAIVDLTGQKPNVYYELGIRHSLRLGTIIITQDFKALPSDLKSYYCLEYKYSSESHLYKKYFENFENDLHSKIEFVIDNIDQSDNPVSDFLGFNTYIQTKEKEKQGKKLEVIIDEILVTFMTVFDELKKYILKKEEYIKNNSLFFTFIDLTYFDSKLGHLLNQDFEYFNEYNIIRLKDSYLDFRKEVFFVHQYWEGTRQNPQINTKKHLFYLMEHLYSNKKAYLLNIHQITNSIADEINENRKNGKD